MAEALGRPRRIPAALRHEPPPRFRPAQALDIEASLQKKARAVRLYYRHVNQAERFQSVEMEYRDNRYRGVIPAAYTDSPYPLQYYFEVEQPGTGTPALHPGFDANMTGQPYFVVRRS